MHRETMVQRLAGWVAAAGWEQLSDPAREALKMRILDALGCALGGWAARCWGGSR